MGSDQQPESEKTPPTSAPAGKAHEPPVPVSTEHRAIGAQISTVFQGYFRFLLSVPGLRLFALHAALVALVTALLALCYQQFFGRAIDNLVSEQLFGSETTSIANSFESFLLLCSFVLGGRLDVALRAEVFFTGPFSFDLGLGLSQFTFLALVGVGVFGLYRWHARRRLAGIAPRWFALANSVILALVFAALSLIGQIRLGDDRNQVMISGNFGTVFLAVFISSAIGSSLALPARSASRWTTLTALIRETTVFTSIALCLFSVAAFVFFVVLSVKGSLSVSESLEYLLLLLALLINAAVILCGLGFFGQLSIYVPPELAQLYRPLDVQATDADAAQNIDMFDLGSGLGAWLLVATALSVVIASIALGVRRGRTQQRFNPRRIWQLPAGVLILWLVLINVSALSVWGGDPSPAGSILPELGFRMSLLWFTPIFLTLTAALISVLAEFAPYWCYRFAPWALTLCGGRKATASWAAGTPTVWMIQPAARPAGFATPDPVTGEHPAGDQTKDAGSAVSPSPVPHDVVPDQPLSATTKKKLRFAGIGLLVVIILLALGFGAVAFLNSQRKPEAEVQRYLQLLSEGHATQAGDMVDPGVDYGQRVLLSDEVLQASEARLEPQSVRLVSETARAASVEAVYSVNGQQATHRFQVARGPKEYGLLTTWHIQDPLIAEVQLRSGQQTVKVSGTQIPLREDSGGLLHRGQGYGGTFYAYPGLYEVTGKSTKYEQASNAQLRVLDPTTGELRADVKTQPTDALEKVVLDAVNQAAEACVEVPSNTEAYCPYQLRQSDLESFSVVERATEVIDLDKDSFTAGQVTFRYKKSDLGTLEFDPHEISVTFRGEIQWEEGEPRVQNIRTGWF